MARYCQGLNDYDERENHWKPDKKGNETVYSQLQKLQEFENIVGDMESYGLGIGQFVISMKGAR
jgi:hypothetical protein